MLCVIKIMTAVEKEREFVQEVKGGEAERERALGPGVISVSAPPLGTSSLRLREHARHEYKP